MIMSYAAHPREYSPFIGQTASKAEPARKWSGVLRRIFDAFMQAQQRDADRQIARFIAARSARTLTDDLEREMFQRLSTSNWSVNANPHGERRFP
jgi:hypothetical protein